jgi:hypothetical protein
MLADRCLRKPKLDSRPRKTAMEGDGGERAKPLRIFHNRFLSNP